VEKFIYNVRNRIGADVGSDHQLVIEEIKLKIAASVKLNESGIKRFDIRKLGDPKIVESFKLQLRKCWKKTTLKKRS
jgi:hypothetical protein